MRLYVYYIVIFSLLLLGACTPHMGPDASLIQDAEPDKDGFMVKRVVELNSCYDLQMEYPVVNEPEIDRQIQQWVSIKYNSAVAEFSRLCQHSTPVQPFKFWTDYDLYSTDQTVSLLLKSWIYAEGGEQYFDTVDTFNYLRANGALLEYGEMFAADEDAILRKVSALLRTALANELGAIWQDNPEYTAKLQPAKSVVKNFAITREGLHFYFPTREIAPFYAGPQQCDLPVEQLAPLGPKRSIWPR